MNLVELDELLARWKRDLDNIVHNTLELTELVTYEMVAGAARGGQRLTGASAERLPAAASAMDDLVLHLRLLRDKLDEALRAREAMPRFMQGRAIDEIRDMLLGPSIVLRADEVPLDQRGLLCAPQSEQRITPEELKSTMVRSFELAMPIFLRVEEVWSTAGMAIARAQADAAQVRDAFERHGVAPTRPVDELFATIDALDRQLREDPLGLDMDLDGYLGTYRRAARAALDALEAERQRLAVRVERSGAKLQKLRALLEELGPLRAQARGASDQGAGLATTADALQSRLLELEIEADMMTLVKLRGALSAWEQDLARAVSAARAEQANLKARLTAREELLFRWATARRKHRSAESPEIQADKALHTFAERIDTLIKERAPAEATDRMLYSFETRLAELTMAAKKKR